MTALKSKLIVLLGCIYALTLHADVIQLKVQGHPANCKTSAKVIITQETSAGRSIIYNLTLPASGTGQVHLLTGNYQISANAKDQCSFQEVIQISDLPHKPVQLKLDKSDSAQSGETLSGNMNQPCSWSEFGCSGNSYPYSESILLAKSNMYFSDKQKGAFNLKFIGEEFNLLSNVPAIINKEFIGELRRGHVYVNNIFYPHLTYSARLNEQALQSVLGFCGTKNEISKYMLEGFGKLEFPPRAQSDFKKYLSGIKLIANKYCVYPQTNAQLDKAIQLKLSLGDKSKTSTIRVLYLVIPQDFKGRKISESLSRFAKKPKSKLKLRLSKAAESAPQFFEWGIGFISE